MSEMHAVLVALLVVLWLECGRLTLRDMLAGAEASDRQLLSSPIADRSVRAARNLVLVAAVVGWPLVQLAGLIRAWTLTR